MGAIKPITTPRRLRTFIVYDGEWIPGSLEMRCVGSYDGARYRSFRTFQAFLDWALTRENRGRWFYAHAGGLADVQFVLEAIIRRNDPSISVDCSFSGSSAIIVHVKRGNNVWHFLDSFWTLRGSLSEIGNAIGMKKGGLDKDAEGADESKIREWYATVPLPELIDYNEQDCRILWEALNQFETALLELGGQLQSTLASCAMHLFRRKYLTDEVPTCLAINDCAKESYFASRVEVFNRDCVEALYYDINSSFPFAMTRPCPGRHIGSHRGLPNRLFESRSLFIADVEIKVPEMYLPPVPIRDKGRVFFPTGQWRSWLSSVDVELLLQEGGEIIRCYETLEFAPFDDLTNYALDLYAKRKACNTDFEKLVYKLLLNSLYGKFAESPEKTKMYINPPRKVLERLSMENMLQPGVWLETAVVPVTHAHVPISTHITAQARRTLYEYLNLSGHCHYCDTDGFATDDQFDTGKELGDLKLEKLVTSATFAAPKVYRIDGRTLGKDGAWHDETIVKAKGFSLGRVKAQAIQRFERLLEDKEINVERMARIREVFRSGKVTPFERTITKALRGKVRPKRFMFPDGSTRPWHVSELSGVSGSR